MIKEIRKEEKEVVLLSLGDFSGRPNEQGLIKADVALKAMKAMGYDALVIGDREVALGNEFVFTNLIKNGIPVVETNLKYNGDRVGKRELIIERGGIKIGLLGVTINQLQAGQEGWDIQDPFDAVEEVLPGLREKADIVVLLSHLGYRQSIALAEHFEGIDVVLIGHRGRRIRTPLMIGGSIMTQSGDKGQYLGRLDISYDKDQDKVVDFSGELVSLDTTIVDDEEMAKLYAEYQVKVKDMVKNDIKNRKGKGKNIFEGPGYLSSVWCRSCHAEIYESWNETPHAVAFLTLKNGGEEYNPECVGCHTTGYMDGGFMTIDESPAFRNVQCEACHGPSSQHVRDKGKSPMHEQNASVCQKCHTGDRGEGFDYEKMKDLVH
jgi:hypothetical protein